MKNAKIKLNSQSKVVKASFTCSNITSKADWEELDRLIEAA